MTAVPDETRAFLQSLGIPTTAAGEMLSDAEVAETYGRQQVVDRCYAEADALQPPTGWLEDWQAEFLRSFSLTRSKTQSVRVAGVTHRDLDRATKLQPEFDAAIKALCEAQIEDIESVAVNRARFGDVYVHQGEVVRGVRKFDTRLQIRMLEAHRRGTYGDAPQAPVDPAELFREMARWMDGAAQSVPEVGTPDETPAPNPVSVQSPPQPIRKPGGFVEDPNKPAPEG